MTDTITLSADATKILKEHSKIFHGESKDYYNILRTLINHWGTQFCPICGKHKRIGGCNCNTGKQHRHIVATISIFDDGYWEYKTSEDIHPIILAALEANMENNWPEELEHMCISCTSEFTCQEQEWFEKKYYKNTS